MPTRMILIATVLALAAPALAGCVHTPSEEERLFAAYVAARDDFLAQRNAAEASVVLAGITTPEQRFILVDRIVGLLDSGFVQSGRQRLVSFRMVDAAGNEIETFAGTSIPATAVAEACLDRSDVTMTHPDGTVEHPQRDLEPQEVVYQEIDGELLIAEVNDAGPHVCAR
ncbi:hypothetical protein [Microbacterium lacusdiani]